MGLVKFYDYDLKVAYTDSDGRQYSKPLKVESMLKAMDQTNEPGVKFDPKNPENFVLSWAIDLGWARWSWLGFKWLLILTCGGLLALIIRGGTRTLWSARSAAAKSDEVLLEVERIEPFLVNGSHHGQFVVHYRLPDGSSRNVTMHPPLVLEREGKQHVVALLPLDKPQNAVILEENLMPFAFNSGEEATIRQRVGAAT